MHLNANLLRFEILAGHGSGIHTPDPGVEAQPWPEDWAAAAAQFGGAGCGPGAHAALATFLGA